MVALNVNSAQGGNVFADLLSSTSNLIMAIVSIANLVLIIRFYYKDIKRRDNEKKAECMAYWLRNMVLPHISHIENYYVQSLNIVDQLKELPRKGYHRDLIMEKILEFKHYKKRAGKEFIERFLVIDTEYANKLYKSIDDYEDYFTIKLSKMDMPDENIDNSFFDKFTDDTLIAKTKLLTEIHQYMLND